MHWTGLVCDVNQHCFGVATAGCSVSELRQEDQPSQHAPADESSRVWSASVHNGKAVQTIHSTTPASVLGSADIVVGVVSALPWLGIELHDLTVSYQLFCWIKCILLHCPHICVKVQY